MDILVFYSDDHFRSDIKMTIVRTIKTQLSKLTIYATYFWRSTLDIQCRLSSKLFCELTFRCEIERELLKVALK